MPGLVPGIPARRTRRPPKRDGRDKPGHDKCYFFNPAASTTGAHFAVSLAIYGANSAGLPPIGSMPWARNGPVTASVLSAALISRDSVATMSAGVPAGASNPNHTLVSKPGSPASVMLGTS